MEKRTLVDQRLAAARRLIAERPELFARQGVVVATWRTVAGRRLGPYYALRYRDAGRQHSVYLGPSAKVAKGVRAMLAVAQQAFRRRRTLARIRAVIKESLRRHRREQWLRDLLQAGLTLRGSEVRRLPAAAAERSGSEPAGDGAADSAAEWAKRGRSDMADRPSAPAPTVSDRFRPDSPAANF